MNSPDYAYYHNGQRHTDTSTAYLKNLGMDDEGIESLQASAKWNAERMMSVLPA
ncbi:hypothetical protein [Photobacterium carnosum]|uniref:hypothetical protein n=1 Tax=Photobacterium carnosum TaxID=2023717 RepID=UPI001E6491D1|nr:hypothetical protein [Photobacterium carnosum]MCD9514053.1 hypothetical protein [Photobacterium carnosum]